MKQKMKMVSQQAISKGVGYRHNIFDIEFQEIVIVAFLDKNVFAVVAAIVDVIVFAVL